LANTVNAPQQVTAFGYNFGVAQFINGVILAGVSDTSQELADKMASTYSTTALGLAAGVVVPRANLAEQTRENFLIAQVNWGPLYTLITPNLLYATTAIVVGLLALYIHVKSPDVRIARIWLTIWGIVVHGFERSNKQPVQNINDLFNEFKTPTGVYEIGNWNEEKLD